MERVDLVRSSVMSFELGCWLGHDCGNC